MDYSSWYVRCSLLAALVDLMRGVGIIICTASILASGLRKLHQPKVIAEVLGGIRLGKCYRWFRLSRLTLLVRPPRLAAHQASQSISSPKTDVHILASLLTLDSVSSYFSSDSKLTLGLSNGMRAYQQ